MIAILVRLNCSVKAGGRRETALATVMAFECLAFRFARSPSRHDAKPRDRALQADFPFH